MPGRRLCRLCGINCNKSFTWNTPEGALPAELRAFAEAENGEIRALKLVVATV